MNPFSPRQRKLALAAHITVSVGWLGAAAVFLALAVAGLTSRQPGAVQGAYVTMKLVGWYVIVPLGIASLVTGVVQSLGTTWGLVRHYWVLAKLLITAPATGLLVVHMGPIGQLADVAARTGPTGTELQGLRAQMIVDASAALLALLTAVVLSVFKPRGATGYGRRAAARARAGTQPTGN
ncbi:hypothetical protein AB0K89_10335 [Streptomyces cinnamoneus]|uniref:hypothetical protein n=1 Tax=Streptomyces cinnamoneus TaxID=53446 RepID=UPI0034132191